MLLVALLVQIAGAQEGVEVAIVVVAVASEGPAPTVSGTLAVTCRRDNIDVPCPPTFTLVDPLPLLWTDASDPLTVLRRFPARPDPGAMTFNTSSLSTSFTTRLPHRFGDVGWSGPARAPSLSGNGGWYPQLLDDGRVVVADWDVTVSYASGAGTGVLVVNGTVGEGTVRWSGLADRAALAVIPRGRVHHEPDSAITLVTRPGLTPTSAAVGRRLLEGASPGVPVTLVQDRDLLHLARAAPGMVYLSDHTFRLLWLFRPYHQRAVRQAMIEATTPLPSGWDRAFVADATARALPAPDLRRTLGWLTWNPVVDALLNDGTLPFYGDIFSEAFPEDPPLLDLFEGRIPARAASRQLDDLLGPGAALAESRRLLTDVTKVRSSVLFGSEDPVPGAVRDGWLARYDVDQDYAIVTERGDPTGVARTAQVNAPTEVVLVTADGVTTPWVTGEGSVNLPLSDTRAVSIASSNIAESQGANNRWPSRWDVLLAGGADGFSPTQGNVDLWGSLLLRPHGDTHHRAIGILAHDEQDIASVSVGYILAFGPLVNRQSRALRLVVLGESAYLDPNFRPTDTGAIAVGGYLSWAWETRSEASLSGHRYGAQVSGGFVPGSENRWSAAGISATQLVPLHPRHILALRAKAGWASGDVEHRLLTLGGPGDLRSLPADLYLANQKLVANLEYRWAVFRNAQVPLPLLWLTELQIVPGVEYGFGQTNDSTQFSATGATLALHSITDTLGVRPTLFGVTLAAPLWSFGRNVPDAALEFLPDMQLYIDFAQGF